MRVSFQRVAVCSVVSVTGFAILVPNLLRLLSFDEPPLGFGLAWLGTVLALVLVGAGVYLYTTDVSTPHAARVAGWNVLGVVVLGAVLYLSSLYRNISAPSFLIANVLAVSAFAHVLIGMNDVRRIRAEALASEREKLAVSNRLVRHNLRHEAQLLHGVSAQLEDRDDVDLVASSVSEIAAGLGEMHDAVQAIQRLVEGDPELERRPVSSIVDGAMAEVRERYPDASVEVNVGDHRVLAGPELDGAIAGLIENAIEYGGDGEPIQIVAERAGGRIELAVVDDGPGIPEDERRVVLGETKMDQLEHGSGMGLWLARWTIGYYGGEFDLERSESGGTRAIARLEAA